MARSTKKSDAATTTTPAPRKRKPKATPVEVVVVEATTKECPFLRAIGADEYVFPATSEFFYKDKSTKDGLAVWSKQGERIYNRGYNARKALVAATEERDALKKGTKAYKEAATKVVAAQSKVDDAAAEGAFLYGRVKRTHGSALIAQSA